MVHAKTILVARGNHQPCLDLSKGRSLVRRDAGTLDARTRHLLSQSYSSNNKKKVRLGIDLNQNYLW